MKQDILHSSSQSFIKEEIQQRPSNRHPNIILIKQNQPIREIINVDSNQSMIKGGFAQQNQKTQIKKKNRGNKRKQDMENKMVVRKSKNINKRATLKTSPPKFQKQKKRKSAYLQQRKACKLNIQSFKECFTDFNSNELHTKKWQSYKIEYSIQQTHSTSSFFQDLAQSILQKEQKTQKFGNSIAYQRALQQINQRLKIASYRFNFQECEKKIINLSKNIDEMQMKPLNIEERPQFDKKSPEYEGELEKKRQELRKRLYTSVEMPND